MPLATLYVPPYHDDFFVNNVDGKNYVRILFRPGRAVQARELTQLQTAIQCQIDRFGQSIYKEGTPVIDGLATHDNFCKWVKVASYTTSRPVDLVGLRVYSDNGPSAQVLAYKTITGTDYLFIKYISNDTSTGLVSEFPSSIGTPCVLKRLDTSASIITLATSSYTGDGSRFSINEGVYFVAGNFVHVDAQDLFDIANNLSGKLFLDVSEAVVTSTTDATLFDNATGSSNYAAPGADRYQISLSLLFKTDAELALEVAASTRTILLTVESGRVHILARTEYSNLERILAQRTYEESGNYTVKPFQIDVREHLDNLSNRGYKTAGNGGDATKIAVTLEPSVAYVDGYRVELADKKILESSKARTASEFSNIAQSLLLGNYVYGSFNNNSAVNLDFSQIDRRYNLGNYKVTATYTRSGTLVAVTTVAVHGLINGQNIILDFTSGTATDGIYVVTVTGANTFTVNDTVSSTTNGNVTIIEQIGTARIRFVRLKSAGLYQFFLSDIQMLVAHLFSATHYITYSNTLQINLTDTSGIVLTPSSSATLYDTSNAKLIYSLPYEAVKTMERASAPIYDTRYQMVRKYSFSGLSSATSVTIATSPFTAESTSVNNYFVLNGTSGAIVTPTLINGTTSSRTVNFAAQTGTVEVYCIVTKEDAAATKVQKVLTTTTKTIVVTGGALATTTMNSVALAGGLGQEDVFDITSIVHSVDGTVTSKYTLNSGQSDEFYTQSFITLTSGQTTPTNGTLTVTLSYFAHTGGAGDYFSIDSYPVSTIGYENVPVYNGIKLANALDFRKKKSVTGSVDVLNPDCTFSTQISQYLPRIDKVVVSASSEFKIISGNPALIPSEPVTPDGHMALHTLYIPAYTFAVKDIDVKFIENRRYTMRDIGAIDARVRNLEYYTSLSLLEKETTTLDIGSRYKNGILVDAFIGHNVGDVTNPDYACSIDSRVRLLRPKALMSNLRLLKKVETLDSNLVIKSDIVMKAFTEVSHISQLLASSVENVNPYNVFSWIGETKLSPSSDEWKDTVRRPDVIVNQEGAYDAIAAGVNASGILGTSWNEWTIKWLGTPTNRVVSSAPHTVRAPDGVIRQSNTVVTTSSAIASRTGSRTTIVPETVLTPAGERVVDTSFVPFIRSRRVYFQGNQLKPNTKMYVFFDGKDISSYCTQLATGQFAANRYFTTSNVTLSNDDLPLGEGGTITSTGLRTDVSGNIEGYFVIPNNSKIRFRTGERTIRIIDNSSNDISIAKTYAEGIYTAAGTIDTVQATVISTRVPRLVTTAISESRTSVVSVSGRVTWSDPLAQSFIVGDIPGGIFASSIDLFFKTKDASIPVSIHLVSCENCIPTQKVIPFSKVTKYPADVNVSTTAALATTFTFDSPVHLSDGIEYAIVVTSNSDSYLAWVAEIGAKDVASNTRITANPYAGVLFKSQNSSTWTPDQTKDLKFVLRRASFNPTTTGTINFNELIPSGTSFSYSLINILAQQLYFPNAGINWTLTLTDENGLVRNVDVNENLDLGSIRAVTFGMSSNIKVSATISSTEYLSGIIDLDRLSMVLVNNIVNNVSTGEAAVSGGSALAKYITRPVVLNNSADRLDIYLATNCPQYTNIKVYVKTAISSDLLDSASWIEIAPYKSIPITSDSQNYTDVQFIAGDDSGEVVGAFTAFTVKVVMLADTTYTSAVPTIKDFRCIASL